MKVVGHYDIANKPERILKASLCKCLDEQRANLIGFENWNARVRYGGYVMNQILFS
jgi:hypothetical protein